MFMAFGILGGKKVQGNTLINPFLDPASCYKSLGGPSIHIVASRTQKQSSESRVHGAILGGVNPNRRPHIQDPSSSLPSSHLLKSEGRNSETNQHPNPHPLNPSPSDVTAQVGKTSPKPYSCPEPPPRTHNYLLSCTH